MKTFKGYVFDEQDVFEAINGSDAVISVLGGAFDGSDKTRSLGMKNIVKQMEKAGVKRIVAIGGPGVLNAGENKLIIVIEKSAKAKPNTESAMMRRPCQFPVLLATRPAP